MTVQMESMRERVGLGSAERPLLRLAMVGSMMLVFLIPISWIGDLVGERMARRSEAEAEVWGKWGGRQRIVGPALTVPYVHRWTERSADGKEIVRTVDRHLTILPNELRLQARIDAEERYRGIFSVPVYKVVLDVTGEFAAPDLAALQIEPELVDWQRSELAVGIADARAIQNRAVAIWNDAERAFQPGPGRLDTSGGIHAPVGPPFAGPRATFAFALELNGSGGLYFTASGQQTIATVLSNWPAPSFQGSWLPAERSGDDDGFRATWRIPFLARNQPSMWTTESSGLAKLEEAEFGVDLKTPVDAHRMAHRSVKYARLFIAMTFGTIWLIEVLAGVRVHPIQYLLIGGALCTFYLLELSLSEQTGFGTAYLIASLCVAGLISSYSGVVLKGWWRALGVATTIAALYAYLYVLLTNEDYALLFGSIGVFAAIAVAMLATRSIDWYAPLKTAGARTSDGAANAPSI